MDREDLLRARRCACGNVRRATRALTRYYDNHMKASGLRVTQFSLLLNITLNAGTTAGELAELLLMDQTTVTRNLDSLIKEGYVEITREAGDARKKLLYITNTGSAKLAAALPLWQQAQERVETELGAKRLQELLKILGDLGALK